ncbi:MAG: MarR family transcriptional regulator [Chitinophagaceae bacterium]
MEELSFPLGRSFAIVAKKYFGVLTKLLENLAVERYYSILILIDKSERPCTQHYICEQLRIDKVSMVRMIDYLIKKEMVHKVLNEKDRREYFIKLTPTAFQLMPEIYNAVSSVNEAALKGISAEQQKMLYKNIDQIKQNLESLPSETVYINYKKAGKKI